MSASSAQPRTSWEPEGIRRRLVCGGVVQAEKILYVTEVLGGISRITFQIGVSALPHWKMLRSIQLLGTRVGPIIRKELTAVSSR